MLKIFDNKFKNKSYPDYWNRYLNLFADKQNFEIPISQGNFVVVDVESTGLNPKKDRILSIGALKIHNNEIFVKESFEIYIQQSAYNPESARIHGIIKNGRIQKFSETDAMKMFIEYIRSDIIVGHSITFDITILNVTLKRIVGDKLKNKILDTIELYKRLKGGDFRLGDSTSLDKLCDEFNIPKSDRHTASGDALITGILFLKIISRLRERKVLTLKELLKTKNFLL